MGVSGDAQGHVGQPIGQVSPTGSTQRGGPSGPPGTTQQSCPSPQHSLLQHVVPGPQSTAGPHTGAPQVPLSQYGKVPSHSLPHSPQFVTSLFELTHSVPQHTNPLFEQSMAQLFAPPLPPLTDPPLPPPPLPAPPFALPALPEAPARLPAVPPVFVVPPV